MMAQGIFATTVTFLLLLSFESAIGVPLQLFFSYGSNAGDVELLPNDDSFARFDPLNMDSEFTFYEETYNASDIYVSFFVEFKCIGNFWAIGTLFF